jgi:hypothetical protein
VYIFAYGVTSVSELTEKLVVLEWMQGQAKRLDFIQALPHSLKEA